MIFRCTGTKFWLTNKCRKTNFQIIAHYNYDVRLKKITVTRIAGWNKSIL